MSYFHGRQAKGAQRVRKEILRAEAEHRALNVQHDRTRAHRLGKCECPTGEANN
jgi:hypothetical protein